MSEEKYVRDAVENVNFFLHNLTNACQLVSRPTLCLSIDQKLRLLLSLKMKG